MQVRLTGYIDVPADRLAAIRPALAEHIRLTRQEPGCISFDVDPDPEIEGRYQVRELFESRTAFDAHQARVKGSDWGEITKGIERHYTVEEA